MTVSAWHTSCWMKIMRKGIILSRKLIRDFPDFPEAYFAFGTFLINGSKQYDSALIYLDKAIELKARFNICMVQQGDR